jgi:hypothetical protein
MEPNEYQVVTNGVPVTDPSHDLMGQIRIARGFMRTSPGGEDQIILQGRTVTPWRDIEIPYEKEVTA